MPTPRKKAAALRYEGSGSPKVVAAGRGLIAERILAAAKEAGVPIREDEALAGRRHRCAEDRFRRTCAPHRTGAIQASAMQLDQTMPRRAPRCTDEEQIRRRSAFRNNLRGDLLIESGRIRRMTYRKRDG